MKNIKNFKRFLTAIMCFCLLITGFTFRAGATENPKTPTIDDERAGTLTLNKYRNAAGADYNENLDKVSGAVFTAYKVSSISSEGVVSLIDVNGVKIDFTSTTSVNSDLITLVKGKAQKNYVSTESSTGSYTFGNMELGIYLVVETKSPANYYATTDAFLVSIPQTNAAGDDWEYDVVARPKNNNITVEKSVTGQGTKADSYSIGDTVPFIVQSTIPLYSQNTYDNLESLEFYFLDTMSDGLDFDPNSVEVFIDNVKITDTSYYNVETENIDGATVKISLNNKAIIEHKGKTITVKYSATLNAAAEITTGEMNSITLTFTTNPQTGEKHKTGPEITKVYTYQMDLTKTFEGTPSANANLSNVKFTLQDSNGLLYAKQVNGVWIINTSDTAGRTTELSLNSDSKLIIKGLEAGSYTLTEVSTIPGYNLLKAPIEVVVEETKDAEGVVVSGVVKANVDGRDIESTTGSFSFQVNNTKGFELPQTGGMGTWMYTLGGLLLMAASAVLMLSMRKRRAVK